MAWKPDRTIGSGAGSKGESDREGFPFSEGNGAVGFVLGWEIGLSMVSVARFHPLYFKMRGRVWKDGIMPNSQDKSVEISIAEIDRFDRSGGLRHPFWIVVR